MNTRTQRNVAAMVIASCLLLACGSTPDTPAGSEEALIDRGASQTEDSVEEQLEWRCEANPQQQWRCVERNSGEWREVVDKTRPAPLSDNTADEAHTVAIETPAPTPAQQPTPEQPPPSQPADNGYVLQLLAARQQATIDDFHRRHPTLDTRQLTVERNGERWQLLVLGPYPDYATAREARNAMATELEETPWIRALRDIDGILTPQ